MSKIGVIGAGTMGSGIAQAFLEKGYGVILNDLEQDYVDNGVDNIIKSLDKKIEKGDLTEAEKKEVLDNLKKSTDLNDLRNCRLVIEAAIENINIKKRIFNQLDSICNKDCVLATNTSSLSITEIGLATERPDKVIGMHFFNPAPVMKLVELINGTATSEKSYEIVRDITESIGKIAVKVKESPGFIVNRLLIPMINEAAAIHAEGIATAEDIDNAMKYGANHPIGPLALADLIGIDVVLAIMETLHSEFGEDKYKPHISLKRMVNEGLLGRKTGEGFYGYRP